MGFLVFLQWFFFVITGFINGNLVFSHRFKYYLNKKKRLARVSKRRHVGGTQALKGGVWGASQWPKLHFFRVIRSYIMSSSFWCNTCQWWLGSLSSVKLSFLSLIEKYNLVLFVVGISTSVLNLLISNFCS
jgi:hypothetical protein